MTHEPQRQALSDRLTALLYVEIFPSRKGAAPLLRELTQLARGNMPLAKGLTAAAQDAKQPSVRKAMLRVADGLAAGDSLPVALGRPRRLMPGYVIALAEIGERSGRLGDMLWVALKLFESASAFRTQMIGVLVYPLALLTVSLGIISGVMIFIVPKFEAMFEEMEIELPGATKLLCNASRGLADSWPWFLIAAGSLALLASRWNWLRYRLPLIGAMARDASAAMLASVLVPMLRAGLDIPDALHLAKESIRDRALARELERLVRRLVEGQTLSEAARRCHALPRALRWLITNGEASGQLPEALEQARDLYLDRCDVQQDYLQAIVQPAATLLLASCVAIVCVGLMSPLVKLTGSIGQ